MFCAKCGAMLEDSALKCDKCGAPVRIRPASAGFSGEKEGNPEDSFVPAREEKGKSSGKDSLQDPVFFKEAGSDIDVNSIIRIARGEDLGEKNEPSSEEEGPRLQEKVKIRKIPAGNNPDERKNITKESWLSSLSPLEKARRRLNETIHLYEGRREEREMHKHIKRAEKYYSDSEASSPVMKAEPETLRKADAGQTTARKNLPVEKERRDQVTAQQRIPGKAEKALAEKAQGNRVPGQQQVPEKSGKALVEKDLLEKARREKEAVQKAVRQARERQTQEHVRLANEAFGSSVKPQKDVEKLSAEKDETKLVSSAAEPAAGAESASSAEAAGLAAKAVSSGKTEAAGETAPSVETGTAAAEEISSGKITAAAETAPSVETGTAAAEAVSSANTAAAGKSASSVETAASDPVGPASRDLFANRGVWTDEDRGLENARLLRRMREDESDEVDAFLANYGLTKEVAVRLATLFLIALLSVIYVMGRGKGSGASIPAEDVTGAPSAEEGEQDGSSEDSALDTGVEDEIPTGGGDFQNTQTP